MKQNSDPEQWILCYFMAYFLFELTKKSQGLCYAVLEFSREPTLLKAKLDTPDKKRNEQVSE